MIAQWIQKVFNSDKLSNAEIFKAIDDFGSSKEAEETSNRPEFLYELAKVHSEAAFILWQIQLQKKLLSWVINIAPAINLAGVQVIVSNLTPLLNENEVLVLKEGKGFLLAFTDQALRPVEKPLAFRKLVWKELGALSKEDFLYNQNELDIFLKAEIVSISAICAGAKFKSFQLASEYASTRIQGGRAIKDWSSIQLLLSELYLSVKADEVLIQNMKIATAFSILLDADQFVSRNMQVFGGAGYIEDYVVERLYRECIFLKNWPKPYKLELINHYQNQVQNQ
ncbi:MAG: acyl-CoA/acyl-ACP dehydrogenase [Bacteriovorax sp.]|nr:acyl-CoA/acyl-ACP dehydrogenase [Bacteriovorax sp.]